MRPRILILSLAYEPLLGGAELAVRNITDRLFDYEFDLVTNRFSRAHKSSEKIGNVNVHRVGFGGRLGKYLYPAFAFRLAQKLHRQKPYEVVWAIMAAYAGFAALFFLRRNPGLKFFLTLQEGDALKDIEKRVRGIRGSWRKIFTRADHIQAISRYLANWAKAQGARCEVSVVPNGVAIENFQFSIFKLQKNSKFQIPKIISVSRLVRKNGLDLLMRAAAELKSAAPYLPFVIQILGTGPEEQNLRNLAQSLGVEKEIDFLGDIDPVAVPNYLANADIFVRPSRSEGLGSAFLEAMAAGLPIIGTPVGGIPEFLHPFQYSQVRTADAKDANGFFANPEDPKDLAQKIKIFLESEELCRVLGQNGQKLVFEQYSWDKIALKMNLILSQMTAD